jgi:hypothetical protein
MRPMTRRRTGLVNVQPHAIQLLNIRIPFELHAQLRDAAARHGECASVLVRRFIREGLENERARHA